MQLKYFVAYRFCDAAIPMMVVRPIWQTSSPTNMVFKSVICLGIWIHQFSPPILTLTCLSKLLRTDWSSCPCLFLFLFSFGKTRNWEMMLCSSKYRLIAGLSSSFDRRTNRKNTSYFFSLFSRSRIYWIWEINLFPFWTFYFLEPYSSWISTKWMSSLISPRNSNPSWLWA